MRVRRRLVHRAGQERVLTIRYEEVVKDPASARARIGHFLGVTGLSEVRDPSQLYRSGEYWKQAVMGEVVTDRRDLWRTESASSSIAAIEVVARREMIRWGYRPEQPRTINVRAAISASAYAGRRQIHRRRLGHLLTRSGAFRREMRPQTAATG